MTSWQAPRQTQALDELQVTLAMQGDTHAFSLLYRRWHRRLLRHAMGLVKHPDAARDVLQDAALAIARNIHRLKHPDKFGPWAYTIVRTRAANHIKKVQRDRTLKEAIRTDMELTPPPSAPTDRADHLRALISNLSTADQEVLIAYYVDGMSVTEIAACFAVPNGTVKSRLHTARTHLKQAYKETEGADHD